MGGKGDDFWFDFFGVDVFLFQFFLFVWFPFLEVSYFYENKHIS